MEAPTLEDAEDLFATLDKHQLEQVLGPPIIGDEFHVDVHTDHDDHPPTFYVTADGGKGVLMAYEDDGVTRRPQDDTVLYDWTEE